MVGACCAEDESGDVWPSAVLSTLTLELLSNVRRRTSSTGLKVGCRCLEVAATGATSIWFAAAVAAGAGSAAAGSCLAIAAAPEVVEAAAFLSEAV